MSSFLGYSDFISIASGDLSGFFPNPTVIKIQGKDVLNIIPTDGYALIWNSSLNRWEPGVLPVSDGMAQPIANLTLLAQLPTTNLVNGTLIYVNNVDDIYYLEKAVNYIPDGYSVVAGLNDGYWVSRFEGRWDDQQGDISQGVGAATLTYDPFRDTPWYLYCMRHDQDDTLSFRFQLGHSWRYDLPVVPHLHMVALADPLSTQTAFFDAYYTWSRPEYALAIPAFSSWTWVKIPVQINNGDVNTQKLVSLGEIVPPSWVRESSILLLFIRRLGTDPRDTYTTGKSGGGLASANIGLLSADVHFRKNKHGTWTEMPT